MNSCTDKARITTNLNILGGKPAATRSPLVTNMRRLAWFELQPQPA